MLQLPLASGTVSPNRGIAAGANRTEKRESARSSGTV